MKTRKKATSLAPQTPLDTSFWQSFAKNIWEKEALALKNVQSELLDITHAEIFDLLLQYSDRCRKLQDPEGFKFYIDGFKADADDVLQVLPLKKDKSLLGYHARMQAEFSDYCLVCDELLQVNQKKQDLLTDFTRQLYQHVGFPNRFSEMGLYLGNYRKTPFGVHVDSCGVFSFPVAGTKKFRLWPEGYGQKNPALDRAFKYDKFKKDSVVLEASPGDMVYWPSSAWHIAESDGSFSATWSLGVWVDQPLKNKVSDSLNDLLDKKLGSAGERPTVAFIKLHKASGEVTDLPESYLNALQALQQTAEVELKEIFLKNWMQHISLQGFKNLPKDEIKISAKSKIKLRSARSPLLWQKSLSDSKTFYVSFGGILVESKSAGLLKLVQSLNAGKACMVGDLLKEKTDFKSLQQLADAGSFIFAKLNS